VPGPLTHRSVAVLAGLLLSGGLVGCDSNPSPAPLPSASSTPTTSQSASPSATPPTLPAAAKGTSAKAAKAFVRYYIDAVNFALRSGDTTALTMASGRSCSSCASVAESIAEVYRSGGKFVGRGWRVTRIKPVAGQPPSKPIMQTGIFVYPQNKVASADARPQHRNGGKNLMIFSLRRRADSWIVSRWDQAA
jgi:Family of unknown function (DUF6318)